MSKNRKITNIGHFKEEVYMSINMQDLILFGIYSVLKNGEVCTFERLVAECFTKFPKVFAFKRYPNWPDALKFDRKLRTLREKGLIAGGVGGRYSPGELKLTPFGERKAKEVEDILSGKKIIPYKKVKLKVRSIEEKLINYLKENEKVKEFLKNRKNFAISEAEFRDIIRCTLETPERVVKQNVAYLKNLVKNYNEKELLKFLSFCENKFLKRR
jgi:hypothetical protein